MKKYLVIGAAFLCQFISAQEVSNIGEAVTGTSPNQGITLLSDFVQSFTTGNNGELENCTNQASYDSTFDSIDISMYASQVIPNGPNVTVTLRDNVDGNILATLTNNLPTSNRNSFRSLEFQLEVEEFEGSSILSRNTTYYIQFDLEGPVVYDAGGGNVTNLAGRIATTASDDDARDNTLHCWTMGNTSKVRAYNSTTWTDSSDSIIMEVSATYNAPARQCPQEATGTYPNCRCPATYIFNRTYDTCSCPSGRHDHNGLCHDDDTVHCPLDATGTYPNCSCPTGYEFNDSGTGHVRGSCDQLFCPSDATGTYPECSCPDGQYIQVSNSCEGCPDGLHNHDDRGCHNDRWDHCPTGQHGHDENGRYRHGDDVECHDRSVVHASDPEDPPAEPDPPVSECPEGQHNHDGIGCHSEDEDHTVVTPPPPQPPPTNPGANLPELTIEGSQVSESEEFAMFAVALDEASDVDIDIEYKTSDFYAKAGEDFEYTEGSLIIAAGDLAASISIPLIDDKLYEVHESFYVDAELSDTKYRVRRIGATIVSDDPMPNLSISDGEAVEGEEMEFTISLDNPSGVETRFTHRIDYDAGTATPGTDYYRSSGVIGFEPGETQFTGTVRTFDDEEEEEKETFYVNLYDVDEAIIEKGSGEMTIIDNDKSETKPEPEPEPELDEEIEDIENVQKLNRSWKHAVRRNDD